MTSTAATRPLLASELYAITQSRRCTGDEQCHWCGAPCTRDIMHDHEAPAEIARAIRLCWLETCTVPSSPWMCVGCQLWRRRSITVDFLADNSLPWAERAKDRQTPQKHSWWIEPELTTLAIRPKDRPQLYKLLVNPPERFLLSLLDKRDTNLLQKCVVNDNPEVKADTPLHFTLDNVRHTYTVYELEEAIKSKQTTGKESGVKALVDYCGPCTLKEYREEKREPAGRGRPAEALGNGAITKRKIR